MLMRIAPIVLAAAALAGCDAATQIAGEAVEGEVRNAVQTNCQQIAGNAGIAAARVSEVCECTADTFIADPELTVEDISPENIEGIVNQCTARTSPGGAAG